MWHFETDGTDTGIQMRATARGRDHSLVEMVFGDRRDARWMLRRMTAKVTSENARKADENYQRELVRVYGKQASDMRYRRSEHRDPALIEARTLKLAADEAMRAAWMRP